MCQDCDFAIRAQNVNRFCDSLVDIIDEQLDGFRKNDMVFGIDGCMVRCREIKYSRGSFRLLVLAVVLYGQLSKLRTAETRRNIASLTRHADAAYIHELRTSFREKTS